MFERNCSAQLDTEALTLRLLFQQDGSGSTVG